MQQIINFFIRNKIGLLYVFLLLIAIGFTAQSHSYHQSKFFNSTNWLSGNLYETSNNISTYFSLKNTNDQLVEENKRLRNLLYNKTSKDTILTKDSTGIYGLVSAKVVKNSYSLTRNYLTIKAGKKQGIEQDMGVVTANGILGIVEHTSSDYSLVQSILNTKSNINAKLKNSGHFGSLTWDGNKYTTVQLTDIPKLVELKVGDTIVTGAMSSIFPENIPIGTIRDFNLKQGESSYHINISLFQDMANVKYAYFVKNNERAEINELENRIDNVQ